MLLAVTTTIHNLKVPAALLSSAHSFNDKLVSDPPLPPTRVTNQTSLLSGRIQGPMHGGTLRIFLYKCTCSGWNLIGASLENTDSAIRGFGSRKKF